MSRKTRVNYDVFDTELDNMSDLVKMFTRKNKRVRQIFEDDDDGQATEKSYGLRLVSINKSKEEQLPITSEKENNDEPAKQGLKSNVKPLSPMIIIPGSPEQINEIRSPFKHPSSKHNRQNISMRRSLFQQPETNKGLTNIICSTPCTNQKNLNNDFFGSSTSRILNSFSPIKNVLSETVITEPDLNGFQVLEKKTPNKSVQLQNLESDLRQQFNINESTPKRRKSIVREKSLTKNAIEGIESSPSKFSARSEPLAQKSIRSAPSLRSEPISNNCSEAMDISEQAVSMYRKSQLNRLSTNNLTNVNTFNMIETPIMRMTKKSLINDSLLAKKLALCDGESDDEEHLEKENEQHITDDSESEREEECTSKTRDLKVTRGKRNTTKQNVQNNKIASESEQEPRSQYITDDSESEREVEEECTSKTQNLKVTRGKRNTTKQNVQNNKNVTESEQELTSSSAQPSSQHHTIQSRQQNHVEIFKKPMSILTTRSDVSSNSLVPIEIVKSFRSLQRPTNESTINEPSQSMKVILPKGKKNKVNTNNKKTEEYLKLEKKVKKTKGEKKKRTLYTQNSICENEEEKDLQDRKEVNSVENQYFDNHFDCQSEIDEEIRQSLNSIRRSLETESNVSYPFDQDITPQKKIDTPKKKDKKIKNTKLVDNENANLKVLPSRKVKAEKKRKNSNVSNDKNEPPRKTNRITRAKAQKSNENEESNVTTEEELSETAGEGLSGAADEGFQSGQDTSVRYDPYRNGCKRSGLRTRKYMRPYWMPKQEELLISYDTFNKANKARDREKFQDNPSTLTKYSLKSIFLPFKNKIEKKQKVAKKQIISTKSKDVGMNQEQRVETESVSSFTTSATHTEIVNKIFENFNNINSNTTVTTERFTHDTTEAYDAVQVNELDWTPLANGLWYNGFRSGSFDGFMKFEGGAVKKTAKTKHSIVKFTLLCGKLQFIISGKEIEIANLGYVSVSKGQQYTIKNNTKETAFVLVTRFDSPDVQ